jgi:hypothetical protein
MASHELRTSNPIIGSKSNVVLGSYDQIPNLAENAKMLQANVFHPPQRLWKFLTSSSETWTATQTFLDTAIRRGSLFCLFTPPVAALPGGSYWTELQYLISKGIAPDKFQLVRSSLPKNRGRQTLSRFPSLLGWDNKRLATKQYQRLTQEVHEKLQFLFTDGRGKIVPNESVPFPPAFDYAFVTLVTPALRLRIAHGRGELGICVAPPDIPDDWHELSMVLLVMNTPERVGPRPKYVFLDDIAQLLRMQMNLLSEALSEIGWRMVTERLTRLYDLPFKEQWEALNKS